MAEVTGNFFSGGSAPRKLENDAPGENWKQRFGKPKNRAGWYGRTRARERTCTHARNTDNLALVCGRMLKSRA